jgi:hypothetical protein
VIEISEQSYIDGYDLGAKYLMDEKINDRELRQQIVALIMGWA